LVRIAVALAAVAVLAGLAFLAWGVLESSEGNGADVPADISLDDVYSRILGGATRPDALLHTTFEANTRNASTGERQTYIGEMWIDARADVVRIETHPGADWTSTDSDGESLSIASGRYDYYENRGGEAYRSLRQSPCPGNDSVVLAVLFPCGGDPIVTDNTPRVIAGASWEGRHAIALVISEGAPPQSGASPVETTSSVPTVTPVATAGQEIVTPPPTLFPEATEPALQSFTSTAYLEPDTLLPLAATYDYEYTDPSMSFTYVIRYEHEFIDWSSVPADFLDPRSIGWRG
jgi:hypothetical protein